jgi:hypothetical protein
MEYASQLDLYQNKIAEQEGTIERVRRELRVSEEKMKIVTRVIC